MCWLGLSAHTHQSHQTPLVPTFPEGLWVGVAFDPLNSRFRPTPGHRKDAKMNEIRPSLSVFLSCPRGLWDHHLQSPLPRPLCTCSFVCCGLNVGFMSVQTPPQFPGCSLSSSHLTARDQDLGGQRAVITPCTSWQLCPPAWLTTPSPCQ